MKVSVAICTWNRSPLLKQTLDHLRRLNIPDSIEWELIVVDNASTDDTPAVIQAFTDSLPIRYVLERQPGHSQSRNTAIRNVTGNLILWTDNDVIVDPNWLQSYVDAATRHPQAAFFGGKIIPVFAAEKPQWLADTWEKCSCVYAARDLGDEEYQLLQHQFPFGANFAVRTEIQKQFLYTTELGRRGNGMLGDDETDCLRRINDAGHVGVWVPAATLQHFIPADRATAEFVSQYFVGQGQVNVMKQMPTMNSKSHALGVAIHNRLCFRMKRKHKSADEWVSHLIRSSIAWGEFRAWNKTASAAVKKRGRN